VSMIMAMVLSISVMVVIIMTTSWAVLVFVHLWLLRLPFLSPTFHAVTPEPIHLPELFSSS
jgi:hypothetical protein